MIGKGGYGKVWKVEMKASGKKYALKELSKAKIISKKSIKAVMNEREMLSELKHPFINSLYYAFQDR